MTIISFIKSLLIIWFIYCLTTIIVLRNISVSENSWNIIHSESLCNIADRMTWFEPWTVKAIWAIMLFPIVRFEHHNMNKTRILHEYIHHLQIAESFWLWELISIWESLYHRFILNKTVMDSYLSKATEQEAYLNQHNFNYLKERPLRATRKYFFHKTNFTLENFQVILKNNPL